MIVPELMFDEDHFYLPGYFNRHNSIQTGCGNKSFEGIACALKDPQRKVHQLIKPTKEHRSHSISVPVK